MKKAFIFPGQGAQYPGMGRDFFEGYPIARETFQEADEILGRKLSEIVFNGPQDLLTETRNSQVGIYVASIAILRVIRQLFPDLHPNFCAGLSLGEYTALTAAGYVPFSECLPLVQHRGSYMHEACQRQKGTMAVVLGLSANDVETLVKEAALPDDLWVANFNCPGQVVISGTLKGIEKGRECALQAGAKRVLPLEVAGAFHSGLMLPAQKSLAPQVEEVTFHEPSAALVMNVPGDVAHDLKEIRRCLIEQVTHSVRWEQSVEAMAREGVQFKVEIGPGKTLAGFDKRIKSGGAIVSVDNVENLKQLEKAWNDYCTGK